MSHSVVSASGVPSPRPEHHASTSPEPPPMPSWMTLRRGRLNSAPVMRGRSCRYSVLLCRFRVSHFLCALWPCWRPVQAHFGWVMGVCYCRCGLLRLDLNKELRTFHPDSCSLSESPKRTCVPRMLRNACAELRSDLSRLLDEKACV